MRNENIENGLKKNHQKKFWTVGPRLQNKNVNRNEYLNEMLQTKRKLTKLSKCHQTPFIMH